MSIVGYISSVFSVRFYITRKRLHGNFRKMAQVVKGT